MKLSSYAAVPLLASVLSMANALDLTVGDKESVCDAATEIIDGIMDYYLGTRYGGTIGMFQQPYYWWESGLVFGGMIDTWKICDNYTYVSTIQSAINSQRGDNNDYYGVANQTTVEANDDQVFWGFTVLEAAERGFPAYSNNSDDPSYADLALNVYNSIAARWDTDSCNGGLRWQILSNMSGWDYKSTISNAGVFALGARLARYTGDDELVKSSSRILRWMKGAYFVNQPDTNKDYYNVYDGADIVNGSCPVVNGALWSYSYALMTMGSAYLYNATGDDAWSSELDKFLGGIEHYFLSPNATDVLYEYQCHLWGRCNNDQRAFRAIVSRTLGEVVQLAPSFADRALKILNASAEGAAKSCSGGTDGHTCGLSWAAGEWDGYYGLGEQIAALEVIQNTVIGDIAPPCTGETCGIEIDDANFTTVPIPTVTRHFTVVATHVETETLTASTVIEQFYTA